MATKTYNIGENYMYCDLGYTMELVRTACKQKEEEENSKTTHEIPTEGIGGIFMPMKDPNGKTREIAIYDMRTGFVE